MLTQSERHALVRRYASGELSMRDLRAAGLTRTTQVMADLADLGLRLPRARDIGPNVASRKAGMARLAEVLGQAPKP